MAPRTRSLLKFVPVALCVFVANALSVPPKTGTPTPKANVTPTKAATTATKESGSPECLYVPGAYQDWKPDDAPVINPVEGYEGLYEGYVNITGSGQQFFKFTDAPDWTHTNYGDGHGGTFDIDGNAVGLSVPGAGYYELTANLNKKTWTAIKTTWSICGDATPGGWEHDTPMTYDPAKQVWTVVADMSSTGSYKFRANNAWVIDFGVDGSGNLQYADNPAMTYNPKLINLTVPASGTYKITLDLHVSGKYTYTIEAQ